VCMESLITLQNIVMNRGRMSFSVRISLPAFIIMGEG